MTNIAEILIRGLILGFSIAAPVGPIGVLVIRRTLAEGRLYGLVSGLGAATADAIYGTIAGFGLTFISDLLVGQQGWFRLIGGAFLVYLGVKTFLSRPADEEARTQGAGKGFIAAYATIFVLTITNPMTILSFVAIFAGLGIGGASDYGSAAVLVIGVFLGSAAWWLLLSGGVSLFRERFSPKAMLWVNRLSGAIITVFGVLALLSLLPR
jgi:threonine/homoserine/homoserine lactone efflux protein